MPSNSSADFSKLLNPKTQRFVKTSGATSKKILQSYIQELKKNPSLYNYLKSTISCRS